MTKIKLIIADTDERYLNRLSDYIAFHYADQFEISVFSEPALLSGFLATNSVHCLLATGEFLEALKDTELKTAFLLLYEGGDFPEKCDVNYVLKYQNVENILREIKTVSADKIGFVPSNASSGGMKLYLAESVAGGTGTTTVAVAFSRFLVHKGKRVLYLNLEPFGSVGNIFRQNGEHDFSDVLYLLKSQKGNLELKIDGIIQKDAAGVDYIAPCRMAMDLQSLKAADMELLLDVLEQSGRYEYVIIDRAFGLSEEDFSLRKKAYRLLYVTSGFPTQNDKLEKAKAVFSMYAEKSGTALEDKALLVYNKYSNRCSRKWEGGFQEVLGFPKVEAVDENAVVEELAKKEGFASLM